MAAVHMNHTLHSLINEKYKWCTQILPAKFVSSTGMGGSSILVIESGSSDSR